MSDMKTRLARDERGGILALFAVIGTALLLVVAFVIDVANWTEHRRHLQVQVDAGVLATGRAFSFCFVAPSATNAQITALAHQYAGDPAVSGSYNRQVDDPSAYNPADPDERSVSLSLNRADFPPPGVDYDPAYDMDPTVAGVQNLPCDAKALQMKARDTSIPSLFSGLLPDAVDFVDTRAQAKVEIRKVKILKGMLPWAVPEVNPVTVVALLVNEQDPLGTVIQSSANMVKGTTTTLNGTSTTPWQGFLPGVVAAPGAQLGTVILSSSKDYDDLTFTGTLATVCGQSGVRCFAGATPTSGLGFMRGVAPMAAPGATAAAPILKDFELLAGACTDDSAPHFVLNGDCDVVARAVVDFGVTGDPTGGATDAELTLDGPGCNGNSCDMTWSPGGLGGALGTWETTGSTIPAVGEGRVTYNLEWATAAGDDTFANVAHPYVVDDNSGPITYLTMSAHTLPTGTHDISITVGFRPSLRAGQAGDDPILLRFASPSGSLNQALDCDHGATFEDEIREGCQQYYKENERDLDCTGYTTSNLPPNPLDPNPANAPDCVAAKTGDVNAFRKALYDRFESPTGGNCSPNLWPDDPDETNLPKDGDPRLVTLFITDFGAFTGSGSEVVPVVAFAGFYATGWDISTGGGSGQTQGCPTNDPHPEGNNEHQDNGDVWGHFVSFVPFVPAGTESEELCAFDEVGVCTAVLTE